jgi:predicted GNAT family N-acyltransferase
MEGEKIPQFPTPDIGFAREEDASDIFRLQQENLSRNVPDEEKQGQGFVSAETPPELLKEIIEQEGIAVARMDDKVVGYLMPMSLNHAQQVPFLRPFIERLDEVQFEGRPLSEYRYHIFGQVCIDKDYRGKGILEKLHQELINKFSEDYDLAVTEISANNTRSLGANTGKMGWKIVDTYLSDEINWHVVILDLRPFRKNSRPS